MPLLPKEDRAAYILGFGIFILLYLFLILSGLGVFNNFYATAARNAGAGWRILGLVTTVGAVFYGIRLANTNRGSVGILALLVLLSLLLFIGFGYPYFVTR